MVDSENNNFEKGLITKFFFFMKLSYKNFDDLFYKRAVINCVCNKKKKNKKEKHCYFFKETQMKFC